MIFKHYFNRLFVLLVVLLVVEPALAGATTSLRVEKDLSLTLLLHRTSTGELIEWPTKIKARLSPLSHEGPGFPVTRLDADNDGQIVVLQSEERLDSFEAGSPPFVYALEFDQMVPIRRFLGEGFDPRISADGRHIIFDRIVDGVVARVSFDTRDWQPEVLKGREAFLESFVRTSDGRLPQTEWMVPLLPLKESISRERLILINRNSQETVVTARLQRGYLTWKRCIAVPGHGAVSVDPQIELRRGTEETLLCLSSPLPISAHYRVEEAQANEIEAFAVPALDPETAASRLMFSFLEERLTSRRLLALANLEERTTKVRVAVLNDEGQEEPSSVQVVSVRPRAVSLVDLSPIRAGRVRVEALDRGQVAGTLIF